MLRDFIKHCPWSAAIFDRNMVYLACSERHLQDFGRTEEQVIGKNHYEIFPDLPQTYRDVHQRALQGFVIKNDKDCFTQVDGSTGYSSWECRPWHDAEGEIGGIILYAENTTEHIRVLQEAKNQAERDKTQLAAVLANMNSGVVVFDLEGKIIHTNDALARILEFQNKSEFPLNIRCLEHLFQHFSSPEGKEIPFEESPLKRLLRGATVHNEKCVIAQSATGRERIVECFGTPILNTNGNQELHLLILTDITERQQAEEELRKTKAFAEQEQAKWLAVLDHISNGVEVYDASATKIYVNETPA